MKIYVVETIFDYCTQIGASLSKDTAERIAKECSKKKGPFGYKKYWVQEYEINDKFTEFDGD